jgi:hypothetical protein
MANIDFTSINWASVEKEQHKGATGFATVQTLQFGTIRLRIVEYSKGYVADHWCQKGHIIHCLEGELVSQLETGEEFLMKKGMGYIVSDELSSHRSTSANGVKLLIIDGDFLKSSS